jgi:hypothetical protein
MNEGRLEKGLNSHEGRRRVDGNFAYINGSIGLVDGGANPAFSPGIWTPMFGLDTSSTAPAVARVLKPSSAIIGPVTENTGVAATGLGGALVPHSAWICGYCAYTSTANEAFLAANTLLTSCAVGLLRIRCTAANTYSIDFLSTAGVTHTADNACFMFFSGSWPIEKITDNLAADLIA